ncbi:undecaprenyl-diphosphate phosphatase [uncultured Clostridium sp.]|jgi:undecaprenyl-diphosphatase|uniref:undecaprenyl-diphosphate phosphatase n=1 Tax=uncultured Clostridium sp. TaxID=59620 RepID=UPI00260B088D|nr:undecaprenyl-diphosphate phosphatase [uncultured Clostridium sp.]
MDFIFIFKAIIIAIVEGLTEFVPVSSTGHMILVGDLIEFRGVENIEFSSMYEVVIQLGAILAVVVLYRKKIFGSIVEFITYIMGFFTKNKTQMKKSETGFRFGINVILGSIPAMICGLTFYDDIKNLFTVKAVGIAFIVGGILLLVIESWYRKKPSKKLVNSVDEMSYKQSFLVGIFQCLAMWPGMSRSASTIMGGWVAGFSTTVATEFTFFLAIPAMVGSSAMDLLKFDYSIMNSTYWTALVIGFVIAFIVSLVVIDKFIAYLKKKPMKVFAIYRVIAGIVLTVMIYKGLIS